MTARAILGRIAELQGCFAKINRDNKVEFYLKTPTNRKPVEVSNGNNLHIEEALESNALEYKVEGKSEQETRSGKNLLEYPYQQGTLTTNGITFVDNGDGTITANGTATANAVYRMQQNIQFMEEGVYYKLVGENPEYTDITIRGSYDLNGQPKYFGSASSPFKIPTGATGIQIYLVILNGKTVTNLILKPMLLLDTSPSEPYEPYGAMPSPEFPSEVECVDGYNLWDNNNFITVIPNENITKISNGFDYVKNSLLHDRCVAIPIYNIKSGDTFYISMDKEILQKTTEDIGYTFTIYDNVAFGNVIMSTTNFIFTYTFSTDITKAVFAIVIRSNITRFKIKDIQIVKRKSVGKPYPYLPYSNIGIKITGKNILDTSQHLTLPTGVTFQPDGSFLINGNFAQNTYLQINRLSYQEGKTYTLSFTRIPNNSWVSTGVNAFGDGIRSGLVTKTMPSGLSNLQVGLIIGAGDYNNFNFKIMIEEGSVATPYEPYKETIVPIDLQGNALCSLPTNTDTPNFRDELIIENGKVKIIKKINIDKINETNIVQKGGSDFPLFVINLKKRGRVWR